MSFFNPVFSASVFVEIVDIKRAGLSVLSKPITMPGINGREESFPVDFEIKGEDKIWSRLERLDDDRWKQVGEPVERRVGKGAPFTFGRALGLGSEELDHGSVVYLDGVAVFNRVLNNKELESYHFD